MNCTAKLVSSPLKETGLKKTLNYSRQAKKEMIDAHHAELSVRRQCQLLGLNRSNLYYEPAGESEENVYLMRLLDEPYTKTPFYGVVKMTEFLRQQGHEVNPKRVRRLLRKMGLEAVFPRPGVSQPHPEHRI